MTRTRHLLVAWYVFLIVFGNIAAFDFDPECLKEGDVCQHPSDPDKMKRKGEDFDPDFPYKQQKTEADNTLECCEGLHCPELWSRNMRSCWWTWIITLGISWNSCCRKVEWLCEPGGETATPAPEEDPDKPAE